MSRWSVYQRGFIGRLILPSDLQPSWGTTLKKPLQRSALCADCTAAMAYASP
jgi:hypothetical protein